jgi:hypothetical protein
MVDHVWELNDNFYSAVEDEEPYYSLFMDTAKAFDSIHHDFIIAILDKQGWPTWFINTVKNLLKDVRATPIQGPEGAPHIRIKRGVKQGCPLSPLLFILAYDPLIRALADRTEGLKVHAAADDVALSSAKLGDITGALEVIDRFRVVSGLGVNTDKTHVLSSRPVTQEDKDTLARSAWPDVKFEEETTYLGVLFGREVTPAMVLAAAYQKIVERVELYGGVLSRISLTQKILTFNTFVTPILSYLGQFFLIPTKMHKDYEELCRKTIIPWTGGAYKRLHLVFGKDKMGLATPLRDLWAANLACLVRNFNYEDIKWPGDFQKPKVEELSCLMLDHVRVAAWEYITKWTSWSKDNTGESMKLPNKRNMYKGLVEAGYGKQRNANIISKLKKRYKSGPTWAQEAHALVRKIGKVGSQAPPHAFEHHLRAWTNALPTGRRRGCGGKYYKTTGPGGAHYHPCFLCGGGEDTVDHFYTDKCPAFTKAMDKVWATHLPEEGRRPTFKPLPSFLFLGIKEENTRQLGVMMSTHWALWKARELIERGVDRTRLVGMVVDLVGTLTKEDKRGSVGSTSTRTKEQKIEAKARAEDLISRIPADHIVAFTDGSAKPNPGPCGAGVYIRFPDGKEVDLASTIGPGSNNIGELWAMGA